MMNNGKIGLALVGGYLLGRTKKAKMALGLGLYLAGKKLDLNPAQLAKTLANSPVIGGLSDQVRKDLVEGTKSALTSAVTQRANSFADSLHERTLGLNDPEGGSKGSAEDEQDDRDERDERDERDDGDDRDERESRGEDRPKPRRKPAATGGKTTKTAKTAKSAAGKTAAGKTASGGRPNGAGGARKTAAKSAAGTARKAGNRGGGNG
ncbi:MAG: hypothetical protein ACRDP3_05455 [Streptomyces sp.]|uniref:hypothetical protein n=1 Tax=Streptomyces sp. TaxID=1931 RepID=UPI003D6C357A